MISVSVVVPTFNMGVQLRKLLNHFVGIKLVENVFEIIFVDDGSTDETPKILKEFCQMHSNSRVECLEQNMGRFEARKRGALAARCSKILFLDTRLEIMSGFIETLARLVREKDAAMGIVEIDTTRNLFCLYWDRSHKFIFRRHFRDTSKPFNLTEENFDRYLKGTGVFLVNKKIFLDCCNMFSDIALSDDTYLMKKVVGFTPIHIDPGLKILWYPRENVRDFLYRLYDRGPGFVEYHIFERKGLFFWVVLSSLVFISTFLIYALIYPHIFFVSTLVICGLWLFLLLLFVKSFKEFFLLAPLHIGVFFAFGFGVLYGLKVNIVRKFRFKNAPQG
jgi:glycosyltransferase involved in cell wall biosynthesis